MKTQKTGNIVQINKKLLNVIFIFIFILFSIAFYFYLKDTLTSQIPISYYSPSVLQQYFEVEEKYGIPWYIPASIDLQEKREMFRITGEHIADLAAKLAKQKEKESKKLLSMYRDDAVFAEGALRYIKRLQSIDKVYRDKVFPIDSRYEYRYQDGWGDARTYGGERKHEGIDIMCRKGTPIRSVGDGVIEKMGWNELGGWRIGIRGDDGIYYYYAHMSRYAPDWKKGDRVLCGEVIGYVGDSGYGPEGTTGKFDPHLHFGIYENDKAVSPFPFLQAWEKGYTLKESR